MLPKGNGKWDTDPQPPKTLSSDMERALKFKKENCKKAVSDFEKMAEFNFFQPTKRRDVLDQLKQKLKYIKLSIIYN